MAAIFYSTTNYILDYRGKNALQRHTTHIITDQTDIFASFLYFSIILLHVSLVINRILSLTTSACMSFFVADRTSKLQDLLSHYLFVGKHRHNVPRPIRRFIICLWIPYYIWQEKIFHINQQGIGRIPFRNLTYLDNHPSSFKVTSISVVTSNNQTAQWCIGYLIDTIYSVGINSIPVFALCSATWLMCILS